MCLGVIVDQPIWIPLHSEIIFCLFSYAGEKEMEKRSSSHCYFILFILLEIFTEPTKQLNLTTFAASTGASKSWALTHSSSATSFYARDVKKHLNIDYTMVKTTGKDSRLPWVFTQKHNTVRLSQVRLYNTSANISRTHGTLSNVIVF